MNKFFTAYTIVLSFLVFAIASFAFAAETAASTVKNPVAFRVEVGSLACKDGAGTASVLFATDPKEGGSYEIFGDMIDQSSMTLDRRVTLKSGTYTWKGVLNEGYYEVPPSIGQFTIPVCGAASPNTAKPTEAIAAPSIKKEMPKNTEPIIIDIDTENSVSDESTATASSSPEKQDTSHGGGASSTTAVIIGLAILGLIIGFFGWRK
ncbi:MAG: hypothetical protein HYT94_04350 [Parcubacteria group bacterium]|nr:hypothetical protein [Parcubacteria group bacterium]